MKSPRRTILFPLAIAFCGLMAASSCSRDPLREALRHYELNPVGTKSAERAREIRTAARLTSAYLSKHPRDPRAITLLWKCYVKLDTTAAESLRQVLVSLSNRAEPHLINALTDPDPKVRTASATLLGDLRANRAVKPLLALLDDEYLEVQAAAAGALAKLAAPQAITPLLAKLSDPNASVRYYAVQALSAFDRPVVVDSLFRVCFDPGEPADIRYRAALGLAGRLNPSQRDSAEKILSDSSRPERDRLLAVIVLENVRTAANFVLHTARSSPDIFARCLALQTLHKLPPERSLPVLQRALLLGTRAERLAAVEALGQISHPKAHELLQRAAEDPSAGIRELALRYLAGNKTQRLAPERNQPSEPAR